MKPFLSMILTLAFLFSLPAWPGGVSVTNGDRIRYVADAGFSVEYAKALNLNVISKVSFRISNEKAVGSGERKSSVLFVVNKRKIGKVEEAKALLAKEFPGREILPIAQPGATGFYWEERTATSLMGRYSLLTSNGDFVEISVEAYAAGNGIAWIAPIVHSLSYDITPPILHELRADSLSWKAGSTQTLHFRIVDDYSGIESLSSLRFDQVVASGEGARFFLNEKLEAEGNGWYKWTFALSPYLAPGKYELTSIYLEDKANNNRSMNAKADGYYGNWPATEAPKVPLLKIEVSNSGPVDTKGPEVIGFRPDNSTWEVGKTYRVYFKMKDDVSGIKLQDSIACISDLSSTFAIGGKGFSTPTKCYYRSEGNDWYSAEYTVSPFLPSGKYGIAWITLIDNADNINMIEFRGSPEGSPEPGLVNTFTVNIHNPNAPDTSGPELLGWNSPNVNWKAGERASVNLKVVDDKSGMALHSISGASFERVDGKESGRFSSSYSRFTDKGDGWFAQDIEVGEFIPSGEYFARFVLLQDNAGNLTKIDCGSEAGSCRVRDGASLNLAPLRINVIR
ncbi:MAG: hypothetical protein EOP11_02090 [Proteobacteria bacterium]|nr:MAG: hypothetical protein EOP11_02090 [Pseudomonadota bacterium]